MLFFLNPLAFASFEVAELEEEASVYFFYDAENSLEIQDIQDLDSEFFALLDSDLNLGYQSGSVWLKFSLSNHSSKAIERWLEVRPAHLDDVRLHRPTDQGWKVAVQGDRHPWSGRSIQYRTSVFGIELAPDETQTFYLQIRSTGSLAASLKLWEPSAMIQHQGREMLILGGFLVAALLLALMNILQSVAMMERLYAVYGAYLLVIAVFLAMAEGVIHYLLSRNEPLYLEPWISLFHSLLILLTWSLLREVVHLQRYYPRLDRGANWLHGLLFLVGIISIPLGWDADLKPWLWQIFIAQLLFNLLLACWLVFKNNRSARFYLLAFGPLLLAALFNTLSLLGWVQLNIWDNVLPALASLVHMLLMQLTVNDGVYTAKKAYEKARDAALNQALEEEQQAGLEQQQFLRTVANEFRTPLAAIQSANELLSLMGTHNPTRFEKNLERQRHSLNRLSQLVDNALSLESFEQMQWRRDVAQVDFGPLAQQVISELRPLIAARDAKVELNVAGSLAGDYQLLKTALHHLVDNALKHNPKGCKIQIDGNNAAGCYRLSVTDDGVGIPEEEQKWILGKFQRGAKATEPGLGIGLYMVDRIIRLHGGKLSLVSRANQGSQFYAELPDLA